MVMFIWDNTFAACLITVSWYSFWRSIELWLSFCDLTTTMIWFWYSYMFRADIYYCLGNFIWDSNLWFGYIPYFVPVVYSVVGILISSCIWDRKFIIWIFILFVMSLATFTGWDRLFSWYSFGPRFGYLYMHRTEHIYITVWDSCLY